MLFCTGIAQYSICTSHPYACPQNFTYYSNSARKFTLNATIIFIGSGMDCCHEGISDPVWTVFTHPGDSGQQVENCRVYNPPGIDICTETSPDFITNTAAVNITGANTTFQIMHSFYSDIDGEYHQKRSIIFNFYYSESEKYQHKAKYSFIAKFLYNKNAGENVCMLFRSVKF